MSSIYKTEININRAIVAFSRPKNIGDFATKAKLHQAPNQTASTIMGRFKAGFVSLKTRNNKVGTIF